MQIEEAVELKARTHGMLEAETYHALHHLVRETTNDVLDIGVGRGPTTVAYALAVAKRERSSDSRIVVVDQFYQRRVGPHRYNRETNPNDAVALNVAEFEANLVHYGVRDRVDVYVGTTTEARPRIDTGRRFGVLSIDADGHIDRDLAYFYDQVEPGGLIIIDDYKNIVDRQGNERLGRMRGQTERDIRSWVENRDPAQARLLLGKHLLIYRIANLLEREGMLSREATHGTTAVFRKPGARPFDSLDASQIRDIERQIADEYIAACLAAPPAKAGTGTGSTGSPLKERSATQRTSWRPGPGPPAAAASPPAGQSRSGEDAARRTLPDIHPRLLESRDALSFLLLGFSVSRERFSEVVDMLDDFMQPAEAGTDELSLKVALTQSVQDAMASAGNPDVKIGITGGLDSRLLYAALLQFYDPARVTPYTLGYPGQYDYEYIKRHSKLFPEDHILIDTRDITWDLEVEIQKARTRAVPSTYSPKSIMHTILSGRGAPAHNIHGFMGDPLIGGTRPSGSGSVDSWGDAVQRFIKKNDRFSMQQPLAGVADARSLLPDRPQKSVRNLDDYELLDFGLRQFQRIMPNVKSTSITPYTNKKWISAIVGIGDATRRDVEYFQLLRREFPDYFPELGEFDIRRRAEHAKFRSDFMEDRLRSLKDQRNPDGTRFVPQVLNGRGRVVPGRQFCEYSDYHNNPSFRNFLDGLYHSSRERGLFSDRFLNDVRTRFLNGSKAATDQMQGLMSLELNIRAGTIAV